MVEVALERDDFRSVHQSLRQLIQGDIGRCALRTPGAARDDDDRARTDARRVGGHRCRRVARGRAHEDAASLLECLRNRDDHAAVLERTGRVESLVFEVQALETEGTADVVAPHERRRPLVEIDLGCRRSDRQALAIASYHTQAARPKRRAGTMRRCAPARAAPFAPAPSAGSHPAKGESSPRAPRSGRATTRPSG